MKPMTPASGVGGMKKPPKLAPSNTGRNRPTMGTSAFHLVDDASATDFKSGHLDARPEGIGLDSAAFGTGTGRARRQVEVNGPQFGITASRGAQAETYPGTLANGRLLKPVMRTPGSEFSGSAASWGPTGPGSSSGSGGGRRSSKPAKPKGSWSAPNKGKTS